MELLWNGTYFDTMAEIRRVDLEIPLQSSKRLTSLLNPFHASLSEFTIRSGLQWPLIGCFTMRRFRIDVLLERTPLSSINSQGPR